MKEGGQGNGLQIVAAALREAAAGAVVRDFLEEELEDHDARVELGAALPHDGGQLVVEIAPALRPLPLHDLHEHLSEFDHHVGGNIQVVLRVNLRGCGHVDVICDVLHRETLNRRLSCLVILHPLGHDVHLHAVHAEMLHVVRVV